jgi:exonuclease SbcC
MKLLAVRGENFRSFGRLELDLNVDGLIAVVGPNGAGKTTIFAAIEWALYGQRGRGAIPVRRDDAPPGADCWVEVEFEVGGRAYLVRRVEGKDAKLIDIETQQKLATSRADTTRQVGVLLGLNRDMFRGTFYARQKEVQALDSDNDGRRREQVELLLGIERVRRAAGHASAAAKDQERLVEALAQTTPSISALQAELEQIERDAQAAAPEVQAAEQSVTDAKRARQDAAAELQRIEALEREHDKREYKSREAATTAQQEAQAQASLNRQVEEATAAERELETLSVAASLVEELAAQEREADRQRDDHERATQLRQRQREALEASAQLANRVGALESGLLALLADAGAGQHDDPGEDPTERLASVLELTQRELDATREAQTTLAATRSKSEERRAELEQQLDRLERAAALDAQIAQLEGAEREAEAALERWHALRAQRTQLQQSIAHDTEHRDAVLAGEAQAACPTCKRPYGVGELDEIAARFDADLEQARATLASADRDLAELQRLRTVADERAKQHVTLSAERQAIGTLPVAKDTSELELELAACQARLEQIDGEQASCAERLNALAQRLTEIRKRQREAGTQQRKLAEARAGLAQSEHEATLFAAELSAMTLNGYDPQAHASLREQLKSARHAAERCAALRAKADGLELLSRRLAEQAKVADEAAAEEQRLIAAAAEIALEENALDTAHATCDTCNRAVDLAHEQLAAANRRASTDSEAVAAARAKLQEGHRQSAALAEHRAELRARAEVAEALGAYRELVSRRARPELEQEIALLLGQTTRGRYSSVQLSDAYRLEIADGGKLHPVSRFSGGEQDLAALCLRLALSKMLARQRGAETGFVLLDEVFGSQDPDRRRALLEQLHHLAESEFRQVFVISHTDDVVGLCDLSVTVVRDENDLSTATGPR